MKILTNWLRSYVPEIPVDDQQLAEDLTLRGIAVEGVHDLGVSADGRVQRAPVRDGHHHQPGGRDEPLRRGARGGDDLRPAASAAR